MADFVRFAREQGIATTCRGSAPGSIVTYTLGITPVDPLHYGLPFERFLNPDRVTMPDIDVDFEDERRDEVINYVSRKYGQDHVAQIITFGTMLARAAIRDVGRVMGMGYGDVDRIAKAVPNQLGIKLSEALELSPQLKEMHDGDPQIGKLIGFAQQLEGVARNASTHAAGVVISREPLTELMPLQKATNSDALMTQYEMHGIEALGLLKFDFLGLSNLTILRKAVDLIREHRGRRRGPRQHPARRRRRRSSSSPRARRPACSSSSPRACAATSASCSRPPSTTSRPWWRSTARARWTTSRPTSGASTARSRSSTSTRCSSPSWSGRTGSSSTRRTSCAAAIALGGFSGPEADMLGYAIRKKKSSVLRSMKETFVERAAERGVRARDHRRGVQGLRAVRALRVQQGPRHLLRPDRLPDRVPQGELHGRVHDVRADRVPRQRREGRGRHRGVPAPGHRRPHAGRPPVRTSGFTVEDEAIRFGLLAVKNVGEGAIESIIDAREAGGEFRSLTDFCTRVDLRLANRKVLESLAKVGALNCFGHPAQVLLGLDDALAAGQAAQRDRISGQTSLFDMGGDEAATLERPLPVDARDARSASGSAGRRSSWGSTSRTTRWARSRSAWAST